jgi:Secreted repeat of unknown function
MMLTNCRYPASSAIKPEGDFCLRARFKPFRHLVRIEWVPITCGSAIGPHLQGRIVMLRRTSLRTFGFGLPLAAVAILATACSSASSTSAASGTTTTGPTPTTTASAAPGSTASGSTASGSTLVLKTAKGSAGIWLTDSAGRTLYLYTRDKGSTSECYGACAKYFGPPKEKRS